MAEGADLRGARAGRVDVGRLLVGTVTFLFTDIESSTRLLHALGDRYADVLTQHRQLVRGAFRAHAGHEVDTQGDSTASPMNFSTVPPWRSSAARITTK
jgi:class 3 adenylate cyclase